MSPRRNRTSYLVLTLLLLFLLTACAQSEAAKAVDQQITDIGEVSLDSKDAISTAESAVAALPEEDRKQLKNEEKLKEARTTYDGLVKQDAADKVSEAIAAIGEVSLDSKEAIAKAREAYDGAEDDVKALVKNAADLEAAEAKLDELQVSNAQSKISAIGQVSLESRAAIDEAKAAYDALSDEQKAKVSNAAELTAAEEQLTALKKAQAEQVLAGMTKEEDKVQGLSFYYPAGWKFYSDGSWVADQSCFIRPYLGSDGKNCWIRVIYNYTGDDWVFFQKLTIVADGQKFYKTFSYYDVVRDNGGGTVWEYMDDDGSSDIDMLTAVANSSETIIRFEGREYAYDYTVKASDKQIISQALQAYQLLN